MRPLLIAKEVVKIENLWCFANLLRPWCSFWVKFLIRLGILLIILIDSVSPSVSTVYLVTNCNSYGTVGLAHPHLPSGGHLSLTPARVTTTHHNHSPVSDGVWQPSPVPSLAPWLQCWKRAVSENNSEMIKHYSTVYLGPQAVPGTALSCWQLKATTQTIRGMALCVG